MKMKLLDVPRNTQINLKEHQQASDGSSFILFHRLDGKFSYCTTEFGGVCHLSVLESIEKDDEGHYYLSS